MEMGDEPGTLDLDLQHWTGLLEARKIFNACSIIGSTLHNKATFSFNPCFNLRQRYRRYYTDLYSLLRSILTTTKLLETTLTFISFVVYVVFKQMRLLGFVIEIRYNFCWMTLFNIPKWNFHYSGRPESGIS